MSYAFSLFFHGNIENTWVRGLHPCGSTRGPSAKECGMELILIAECGVSGKKLTVGIQANKAKHSSGRIVVYGNSVTGWTS